jgi:tRNA (cmo5U34)-methyltransferase
LGLSGYDNHTNGIELRGADMALHASDSTDKIGEMGSVGHFFGQISAGYDEAILKGIPPYAELIGSVLGYCFMEPSTPWSILELGCGTGNLSLSLREMFPNAQLTLVDLSPDMLTQAMLKLGSPDRQVDLVPGSFMALEFQPGQFDLVVSSMALHHLQDADKPEMYRRIFSWLKPGGLFRCADETLSLPAQAQERNMLRWEAWALESGATPDDLNVWITHAEQHDHYASLANHFEWLQEAGFKEVDCYWRKLMWTTFGARKP